MEFQLRREGAVFPGAGGWGWDGTHPPLCPCWGLGVTRSPTWRSGSPAGRSRVTADGTCPLSPPPGAWLRGPSLPFPPTCHSASTAGTCPLLPGRLLPGSREAAKATVPLSLPLRCRNQVTDVARRSPRAGVPVTGRGWPERREVCCPPGPSRGRRTVCRAGGGRLPGQGC